MGPTRIWCIEVCVVYTAVCGNIYTSRYEHVTVLPAEKENVANKAKKKTPKLLCGVVQSIKIKWAIKKGIEILILNLLCDATNDAIPFLNSRLFVFFFHSISDRFFHHWQRLSWRIWHPGSCKDKSIIRYVVIYRVKLKLSTWLCTEVVTLWFGVDSSSARMSPLTCSSDCSATP